MAEEAKPKTPAWRALRENIEAIVIAFTFALIIRCFFIEVFEIPTSSMEPTLLGQDGEFNHEGGIPVPGAPFRDYHVSKGGDRIMVTKFYYGLTSVDRFDVVVFKFPLNIGKNFIKRVVGLPGEDFMLIDGNIYTRPSGRPGAPFRIATKPLSKQDSIWIRMGRRDGFLEDGKTFRSYWDGPSLDGTSPPYHVRNGRLETLGGADRDVMFEWNESYRDYPKELDSIREADDVRLSMTFRLADATSRMTASLRNRYGEFTVELGGRDQNLLVVNRPDPDKPGQPKEWTQGLPFRISADRQYRMELMVYDGLCVVRLDGEAVEHRFVKTDADADRTITGRRWVRFGVEGGNIEVEDLRVARDIHYKIRMGADDSNLREGVHVEIPEGSYLMMGDNTQRSQDARAWRKVTFKLNDGRVIEAERLEVLRHAFEIRMAARKLGVDPLADILVRADRHGNTVPINLMDIVEQNEEPFMFVEERFIVGKALWIWWPFPERWFTLIR